MVSKERKEETSVPDRKLDEERVTTYLADRTPKTTAAAPPTAGRYTGFATPAKAPIRRAKDPPKQTPGKRTGSSTPSDMPTTKALIARMYRNPIATSESTGTKSGSRNVYVRNAEKTAARQPEKNRRLLFIDDYREDRGKT